MSSELFSLGVRQLKAVGLTVELKKKGNLGCNLQVEDPTQKLSVLETWQRVELALNSKVVPELSSFWAPVLRCFNDRKASRSELGAFTARLLKVTGGKKW